jgi:hypothetical protein
MGKNKKLLVEDTYWHKDPLRGDNNLLWEREVEAKFGRPLPTAGSICKTCYNREDDNGHL